MAAQPVDQNIAYEEFDPFCKWQRNEDRDILEIHLQDFKKEQLKVLISNHGVLKIFGERPPIDASNSKGIRFYKEVAAPSTKYDTHSIYAKFINNNLTITLPKAKPLPDPSEPEPSKIEPTPKPAAAGAREKAKAEAEEKAPPRIGGNAAAAQVQCQMQLCRKRPLAVNLAVTVVIAAVLAAYVHFMYKSTVDNV